MIKYIIFTRCLYSIAFVFCMSEDAGLVQNKNPWDKITTIDLIRNNGYLAEEHHIVAPDGAITVAQRILHSSNGSGIPILINHGLIQSSFSFVRNLENNSLAFLLANRGYDVWLANLRGTSYSNKNIKYSQDNPKFWDFSFQEAIEYDIPLLIDHILEKTGHKKIVYIGFSVGTIIGFGLLASKPEYNDKVYGLIQTGPVIYLHNSPGYVKGIGSSIFGAFSAHQEYFKSNHIFEAPAKDFLRILCAILKKVDLLYLFYLLVFQLSGDSFDHLNRDNLETYISQGFDSTSMKLLAHLEQIKDAKKFQKYDYGTEKNWRIYNESVPPLYDTRNIKVPVGLFWSTYDKLADPWDVQLIHQEVRNIQYSVPITSPGFGHLSFLWSRHAKEYLHYPILKFMTKIIKTETTL